MFGLNPRLRAGALSPQPPLSLSRLVVYNIHCTPVYYIFTQVIHCIIVVYTCTIIGENAAARLLSAAQRFLFFFFLGVVTRRRPLQQYIVKVATAMMSFFFLLLFINDLQKYLLGVFETNAVMSNNEYIIKYIRQSLCIIRTYLSYFIIILIYTPETCCRYLILDYSNK